MKRSLDPERVSALVPYHREPPEVELLASLRDRVADVLLVDDGAPVETIPTVARLAETIDATLLRLPANAGKGHAIAAGLRYLLARRPPPEALLLLDADGQHPPEAIPAFLEAAAGAELVVGNRFGDLTAMPWERRVANVLASRLLRMTTRRTVYDSQCGMRLLRGRALYDILFPGGRYEAETRHLKRCLRAGVTVTWVPIPTLYPGHRSSFRPVVDTARVLTALLA